MFSSNTELLTSEGFVPFHQVDDDHHVAFFDPATTGFIGFDLPDDVLENDHTGSMLSMTGKHSISMTPLTKLYASLSRSADVRTQPDFQPVYAIQLTHGTTMVYQSPLRMCRAGQRRNSSDALSDLEMYHFGKLIGFFLGDGHAESTNQIVFFLKKRRKRQYLRDLSAHIPYQFKEQGNRFIFAYPSLGERWREWFYNEDGQKRLHPALFAGTVPYYLGILDGLKNSDGYRRAGRKGWEYATTSPDLVRDIQAVGAVVGEPFSVTEKKPGTYRLYTQTRQTYPHINDARNQVAITMSDYEGMVYNVVMPGQLICIRHHYSTWLICSAL